MTSFDNLTEALAAKQLGIEYEILVFLRLRNPDLFFLNWDGEEYFYCPHCLDRDAEEIRELSDAIKENWGMDTVIAHVSGLLQRSAA